MSGHQVSSCGVSTSTEFACRYGGVIHENIHGNDGASSCPRTVIRGCAYTPGTAPHRLHSTPARVIRQRPSSWLMNRWQSFCGRAPVTPACSKRSTAGLRGRSGSHLGRQWNNPWLPTAFSACQSLGILTQNDGSMVITHGLQFGAALAHTDREGLATYVGNDNLLTGALEHLIAM